MKIHFLSNRTSKWAEKYQSQRYKIELEKFTIKPINFIFLLQPLSFSIFGSAGFFLVNLHYVLQFCFVLFYLNIIVVVVKLGGCAEKGIFVEGLKGKFNVKHKYLLIRWLSNIVGLVYIDEDWMVFKCNPLSAFLLF